MVRGETHRFRSPLILIRRTHLEDEAAAEAHHAVARVEALAALRDVRLRARVPQQHGHRVVRGVVLRQLAAAARRGGPLVVQHAERGLAAHVLRESAAHPFDTPAQDRLGRESEVCENGCGVCGEVVVGGLSRCTQLS